MPGGARHSEELKLKVVQCYNEGNSGGKKISYAKVGERFMISRFSVATIVKNFNERNSVENKHGGIYVTIIQRLSVQISFIS